MGLILAFPGLLFLIPGKTVQGSKNRRAAPRAGWTGKVRVHYPVIMNIPAWIYWLLILMSAIPAISVWFFFPERKYFLFLVAPLLVLPWPLFAPQYLFYAGILYLGLLILLFLGIRRSSDILADKNADESVDEPTTPLETDLDRLGLGIVLFLGGIPLLYWFGLCLPELVEALKLRPEGSPTLPVDLSELRRDFEEHWETLLFLGGVVLILALAIVTPILQKLRGGRG